MSADTFTPTTLPSADHLIITTAKDADEVASIFATWANEQQWNAGKPDPYLFYKADPTGFFIASLPKHLIPPTHLDSSHTNLQPTTPIPISIISAIKYSPHHGFIGYYIVRNPSFRNKGYGIKIFKHAMRYLGSECNVGLDGVVEQQSNYIKSGFVKVWDNVRFNRPIGLAKPVLPLTPPNGLTQCTDLSVISAKILSEYECIHSGLPRSESFIKEFCSNELVTSIALLKSTNVTTTSDISTIGFIRKSETGYRIGPIYGDSIDNVVYVVKYLLNKVPSESEVVFVDVCFGNEDAKAVFKGVGFDDTNAFVCGRMWTKGCPVEMEAVKRCFAVLSLEIG
ncbi:hypothetical protein HDU76_005648 [Blyttiomyces sp. JEL0837]|nr:hypothetical protein HDU76_005648 [Blyttiomyces sp. JEL0837]